MISRAIRTLGLGALLLAASAPLTAAPRSGKMVGVVTDPSGIPQMGARVLITAEQIFSPESVRLLTDEQGQFAANRLHPGLYAVRVTLAGFLPAIEQHVRVNAQGTTNIEIELGSVLSVFRQLRRQPNQPVGNDEWSWVLRTSSATRPVLRWADGDVIEEDEESPSEARRHRPPLSRLELTTGSGHSGSVSNQADSPGGAFAYDQGFGITGHLLLAGQFSYESASPSGGFATVWLPTGDAHSGPMTSIVVRKSQLGPDGPSFNGLRIQHESELSLGDHVSFRYGAEYLMANLVRTTSAVRPHAEVAMKISPGWQAQFIFAANPWSDLSFTSNSLESAINSLEAFPTLLLRDGHPVLEDDWHQELAVEHISGDRTRFVAAVFHDRSSHTAVFGRGPAKGADFLPDFFSNSFAYDAGKSGSWGTRVALEEKLSKDLKTTVVYSWAGALAPDAAALERTNLRAELETRYRHAMAGSISSQLPCCGTQLTASYKWLSGPAVSRQDAYGDAFYHLDPYLNLAVRQPVPYIFPHHMEAIADFGNLLAQGYVPVTTRDGRVVLLPSLRTLRGGVSVQF